MPLASLMGCLIAAAVQDGALELGPDEPESPAEGPGAYEEPLGVAASGGFDEAVDLGAAPYDEGALGPWPAGPWAHVDERGIVHGDLRFGGWLRTSLLYRQGDGTDDLGADLDDLRVLASGSLAGIDLVLSSELSDDPELTHAYAFGHIDERHEWILGRFRLPFLHSSLIDEDRTLFLERSLQGEAFDIDELGLGLRGNYRFAEFTAALQNSPDEARDALRGTFRASFHLEDQAQPRSERPGVGGARPITALTFAYTDDASLTEGDAYAIGLDLARAGKRLQIEWLDTARDLGDGQPFSVTGSAGIGADGLELGVRYQDLDDPAGTSGFGLVTGRSLYGDLLRWQAGIEYFDSDDAALDGIGARIGVVLSL